jgi:hypothetical protein
MSRKEARLLESRIRKKGGSKTVRAKKQENEKKHLDP